MSREMLAIPIKDQLDATMARAAGSAAAPGAQAALMCNGERIWTGVHGLARVDQSLPVSDETPFCLASFGKLILAACTMHQVERGVIGLDLPIAVYLGPGVPGADTVTVRMLLTHTAGFPDVYASPELSALFPPELEASRSEVAAANPVRNNYDPDRPFTWSMFADALGSPVEAGEHWAYSNTGYIILARVLVQALGGDEEMERVCSQVIHSASGSRPMGDDLLTLRRSARVAESLAHGYQRLSDGLFHDTYLARRPTGVPVDLFGLPFGDGLFAGTAIGAAQFLDSLFIGGTLLDSELLQEMVAATPQAMAGPAEPVRINSYGMGTFRTQVGSSVWQGHSGSYGGYTTMGASEISAGFTLVVTTNGLPPFVEETSMNTVVTPACAVWNELAAVCADYFAQGDK